MSEVFTFFSVLVSIISVVINKHNWEGSWSQLCSPDHPYRTTVKQGYRHTAFPQTLDEVEMKYSHCMNKGFKSIYLSIAWIYFSLKPKIHQTDIKELAVTKICT